MRSLARCSSGSRRSRATSPGCDRSTRAARRCSVGSCRSPPAVTADAVEAAVADGARIVDARPASDHVAGHIPGSLLDPASTTGSGPGSDGSWTSTARGPAHRERRGRRAVDAPGHPDRPRAIDRPARWWVRRLGCARAGRPRRAGRWSATDLATALAVATRPTQPARHRRPAGLRVRGRSRPGCVAHQRRVPARPPRRSAPRPRHRVRLRGRVPGVDRRVDPARGRVRARAALGGRGFPAWQAAGYPVSTGLRGAAAGPA